MIKYEKDGKFAHFCGLKFTRDDRTGYYLNSTIRQRLHRYVWQHFNGPIPEGYHIHHRDGNKGNNDIENLAVVSHSKHTTYHGIGNSMDSEWMEWSRKNLLKNAIPAASEWHGSEEGREWHKEHYENMKDRLHATSEFVCEFCGEGFEAVDNGQNKFCSNRCKSAWRRASGIDDEVRKCAYCGENFTVNKYKKTKCCSKTCSNKLYPRLPQLRKGD